MTFPWHTDPLADESATGEHAAYYRRVYAPEPNPSSANASARVEPLSAKDQFYIDAARSAAAHAGIVDHVSAFVQRYGLGGAMVLDVGAGSGLLQDIVQDYTGLDISPTVRRFFHKPFIEASATAMPFAPSSFDALWSIWVLEHIPNPERALMEMRRVVKPGGYIYLWPAYEVDRYAARGYDVRPYSDFGWGGKLVKATIPIARSRLAKCLYEPHVRLLRLAAARFGSAPSRFRFIRLAPNYDEYWVADSDATTSFTKFELHLWFASRGDDVLESAPLSEMVSRDYRTPPLIVRVRK
jgi:SAM-dependent methyltransferase